MTPEEKVLDSKYRKKFGWSLNEVNRLSEKQGGVCAICKRPPKTNRLSVDHDHAYDRAKVKVIKTFFPTGFLAYAEVYGEPFSAEAVSRADAKELLRCLLRRASVRGLLCFLCNGGIQKFEDSKAPLAPAERFDRAAKYFRDFRSLSEQAPIENPQGAPLKVA